MLGGGGPDFFLLKWCNLARSECSQIRYYQPKNQQFQGKFSTMVNVISPISHQYLGPSINELVTDGNTKLCCRGFILALFQSTIANKIDSEHTLDYKRLLPVGEAELLRVTVKRFEVF